MDGPWRSLTEETKTSARTLARMLAELSAFGVRSADRTADAASTPQLSCDDSAPLSRLFGTLDSFPVLVGYLQGRRSDPLMVLTNEAAVQDLLYLSLKPMLPELVYEEPTRKGAAGYSIGDFSLMTMKLVLEVKYVKVAADVRAKANEIAQDIWQYSTQTDCQTIIFFVYDPHMLIPDRPNFISKSSGEFESQGRRVTLYTMIKPG